MESSRSRFDPAVAEPRAWNVGVGMGNAIGLYAIPYMITPHLIRNNQFLMGLQSEFSMIAMAVFLLLAPAVAARCASRAYMAYGLLPLAIASIWFLVERFIRMTLDSSASFSLSDSLVYAGILTMVWLVSTCPVALYRYWTAFCSRQTKSNIR